MVTVKELCSLIDAMGLLDFHDWNSFPFRDHEKIYFLFSSLQFCCKSAGILLTFFPHDFAMKLRESLRIFSLASLRLPKNGYVASWEDSERSAK